MHWTPVTKGIAIVLGVLCVAVAYNLSTYLSAKINWMPKTRKGQMLELLVYLGCALAYVIIAYKVYTP